MRELEREREQENSPGELFNGIRLTSPTHGAFYSDASVSTLRGVTCAREEISVSVSIKFSPPGNPGLSSAKSCLDLSFDSIIFSAPSSSILDKINVRGRILQAFSGLYFHHFEALFPSRNFVARRHFARFLLVATVHSFFPLESLTDSRLRFLPPRKVEKNISKAI